MKIKICIKNIGLFISLIYVLLRPFLNTYFTEGVKYIFVLVIVYYVLLFLTNKRLLKKYSIPLCFTAIFWVYVSISSLSHGGFELLTYSLERYMFYTTAFFVFPVATTKINWKFLMNFMILYGVVDAFFSITEFITHKQILAIGGVTHNVVQLYGDNSIRTFGLNGDYFLLAELLSVCAFCSFYMYKETVKKSYLIAFLIVAVGIFSTGSRGYYVAFSLGMLAFLYCDMKKRGVNKYFIIRTFALAFLALSMVIFIFFTNISIGIGAVDTVLNRFRSITDFSDNAANVTRYKIWIESLNEWKNHLWFGNGASSTDMRYSLFKGVTESGVLKRLVELGLIGTLLQYLTMFYPLLHGIKEYTASRPGHTINILFISIIVMLMTEDCILQRYGEIEHTVILWFAISALYLNPQIKICD